jgi:RNA polymerase sigma-70 factor (ECF subfamily)
MAEPSHEDFLIRFTRAQPVLRRFVLAHVPDFHEAEDTLQKVALALWRKFPSYDPAMKFEGWAFGVARREVLHTRRSSARMRVVFAAEVEKQIEEHIETAAPQFDERKEHLEKCLEKLPAKLRAAVAAKYEEELDSAAAAEAVGVSVNALRVLLCRARQFLDECMRKAAGQGERGGSPV